MKTIFTRLHLSPSIPWMRLPVLALFFACWCTVPLSAQVSIGAVNPDPSAMLDVSATNKGMLIPRLTTAQRNAIAAPATGLQIFNLDDKCTDLFDGTNWIKNCGLRQVAIGDSSGTNVWVQKANFGGTARYGAVGFSIGTKGYIGTGNDYNFSPYKDFWEYDPTVNTWTQKADFGGSARENAVGFGIGSKGYIGTGYDGTYRSDFWEYDPGSNSWTVKANFGGTARNGAVGFGLGTKGYIGTGYDGTSKNDFWEFDPVANSWTPKANFGGTARRFAVGFGLGTKGYIGTGYDGTSKNDFWEYNPITNTWGQKADLSGSVRYIATGFSIGNTGYIGTGYNNIDVLKDFWEYEQISNTWIQKADIGNSGRHQAVGFSIGLKGYIGTGTGVGFGVVLNDFWQYTPTVLAPVYATPLPAGGASSISDGAWTTNGPTVYNSNTGNVGIGTGSPAAKLDVVGKTQTTDLQTTNLQVTGGTPAVGKVLVSDVSGNATWSGGGVIAQSGLIAGSVGSSRPSVALVNEFFGPTVTLTLTANQRVVMMTTASMGRNAVGNTGFILDIGYSLCCGGPVYPTSGANYIIHNPSFPAGSDRQSFTMIGSVKPGAGDWVIGSMIFCDTVDYLHNNDYVNGYYMIINEN